MERPPLRQLKSRDLRARRVQDAKAGHLPPSRVHRPSPCGRSVHRRDTRDHVQREVRLDEDVLAGANRRRQRDRNAEFDLLASRLVGDLARFAAFGGAAVGVDVDLELQVQRRAADDFAAQHRLQDHPATRDIHPRGPARRSKACRGRDLGLRTRCRRSTVARRLRLPYVPGHATIVVVRSARLIERHRARRVVVSSMIVAPFTTIWWRTELAWTRAPAPAHQGRNAAATAAKCARVRDKRARRAGSWCGLAMKAPGAEGKERRHVRGSRQWSAESAARGPAR